MSAGWEHAPTTSRANAAGETSRLLDQIFAVRIKIKTVQNKSGFFSEKRSKNEKSLQSRPLVARHGEADRSVYGQERQTGLFMAKRGRQVCLWPREADRSVYGQERQTGLFMAKRGRQVCLWPREADRSVYGQERQTGLFMAKRGRQSSFGRNVRLTLSGQSRLTALLQEWLEAKLPFSNRPTLVKATQPIRFMLENYRFCNTGRSIPAVWWRTVPTLTIDIGRKLTNLSMTWMERRNHGRNMIVIPR
ncbi:hypothetical protein RRG08_053547 [Elysia crispata]|uniref:Uncharacterized protein n=1 Tax=Elysia crispata TaxID=231223 RepID=A0AAE1CR00_9GAST|nr:hypothetical protein RRG08_053547 [Elysia crispata]